MGISYDAIAEAGGISKGPSRFETKKARQLAAAQQEREVYAAVTRRDESCCRVCGKWCNPRAIGLLLKPHHHHITYRSRGGETSTANVCLLDSECHQDEHAGKLQLSGDADQRGPDGRLCGLKIERPGEAGWEIVGWR